MADQLTLGDTGGGDVLDPHREAMARAGRLLAVRPRTEKEIRDRLSDGGIEPDVVEGVIRRLSDLGLVDDFAFAAQWVEERSRRKGLGPEALISELEAKGVTGDTSAAALAEAGLDEERLAVELASKLAPRVIRHPLAEQGARLQRMLVGKGFSDEVAEAAARSALPPEGWD